MVQPTPLIAMLNVHQSCHGSIVQADALITSPAVSMRGYLDGFGNWCTRMVAPAGPFVIGTDGIFVDQGLADPVASAARQLDVSDLPPETLVYLLGSRYCDTDVLSETAWRLFGAGVADWSRVQDICDHVHRHVAFDYGQANSTRSASQTMLEGRGVCRDFTHLAISFCRCLNIPTRYCTGYLSDIGEPEPYPPGDFAAWMEVFLEGRWWVFDPRNNSPRRGRILVARGRDAADVPLVQTFGSHLLTGFEVWTHEISEDDPALRNGLDSAGATSPGQRTAGGASE